MKTRLLHRYEGFTVAELVVSMALVGVLLTLITQWFAVVSHQQSKFEQQRQATQIANNVMERVFALAWDELSADNAASIAKTYRESGLFDCEATVESTANEAHPLQSRLIRVRVTSPHGSPVEVVFVAWRFAQEANP